MKITYIHQYYKTPEQGGAIRSYHIANAMVNAGHEVNLITTHNETKYTQKKINRTTIHYLPIKYSNNMGFVARIWSFIKFSYKAYHVAKQIPTDIVYATSTPLLVGWTALKLKKKLNLPFIFEVRDLWPEAPKQLGVIKNMWLLSLLTRFETQIYQNANRIIALSPGMKKGIEKHVDPNKIDIIPNFSDNESTITKGTKNNSFTITYTGALGYANDIPFIKWLIEEIDTKFDNRVTFKIQGEGKFQDQIEEACKNSQNSKYYGFVSKEESYLLLASSDAALTTFINVPILETNSPNKFFDGLATSNISLINFGGWIEDAIKKHKCGNRIRKSNFTAIITDLLKKPNKVIEMKSNAKQLAVERFDKKTLCKQLITVIESQLI